MKKIEKATPNKVATKVTKVTTNPNSPIDEEWPLKKGDTFLFVKDGNYVYYTRSTANVLFTRGEAEIEIPKGSKYTPPKGSKCKGC